MMRRYIGRATGQHRGKKSWAFKPTPLFWLGTATGTLLLAAVLVWIINPGADVPDGGKESVSPTLVTPDSESPSTSELNGSA
jgi:hypothetical protein